MDHSKRIDDSTNLNPELLPCVSALSIISLFPVVASKAT